MRSTRRIRHLALRGPDAGSLRTARPRVEDAFHTATLPAVPPGGVLVIRRLDLGRISARWSGQAVASEIAARVRALSPRDVRTLNLDAGADVVWFPSPVVARAKLLAKLVRGRRPSEWFWRAAVQEWRPTLSATQAARCVLVAVQAGEIAAELPAAVRLGRFVEALMDEGVAEEVLALIVPSGEAASPEGHAAPGTTPEDLRRGARAARRPPVPAGGGSAVSGRRLTTRWQQLLAPLSARLPASHPIATLLAGAALGIYRPELATSPRLPEFSRALWEDLRSLPSPGAAGLPERPRRAAEGPTVGGVESDDRSPSRGDAGSRAGAPRSSAEDSPRSQVPGEVPLPTVALGERLPTEYAGLLFLLPVLARLGLEGVLARDPELVFAHFGWRILDAIADRCGVHSHDPMRRAIVPVAAPHPLTARAFVAPEAWWPEAGARLERFRAPGGLSLLRAPGGPWLAGTGPGGDPHASGYRVVVGGHVDRLRARRAHLDAWIEATERWCVDVLDRPAVSVLRRPGTVTVTETHLDVVMPVEGVDVDIRRAALDADPGWVPWLGRVVAFHYEDS